MKKFTKFLTLIFLLNLQSSPAQVSWKVDNTHGHMEFSLKYMALGDYEGRFKVFDGKIQSRSETDFTGAVFNILININSVSAADVGHEELLKSEDFFDADHFPVATFRSTSMTPGVIKGNYDLEGELCVRGITKKIKLSATTAPKPVTNPYSNATNYALTINGTIKRSDYGIGRYELMDFGGLVLSDEVQISCFLILIKSDHSIPVVNDAKHKLNEKILAAYVGQYEDGNGGILSVSSEHENLFIKRTNRNRQQLFPLNDRRFILEFYEIEIDFGKMEKGNVKGMSILTEKQKTDAKKISDTPEIISSEKEMVKDTLRANYNDKAWEALVRKNYAEAIEYCLAGIELDKNDLYLRINLAHAYLFSGNSLKALNYYKENINKKFEGTIPFTRMIQEDFTFFKSRQYPVNLLDKTFKDLALIPVDAYKSIN